MRVLGIVQSYNEEDCVGNAVRSLVRGDVDVIVFDHGSTDASVQEAVSAGAQVHHVNRNMVPPADEHGRQSAALLNYIGEYIRWQPSFDWVVWQAADEIIRQPDGTLLTVKALEAASRVVEVIRPLIRNFRPRITDDQNEPDYLRRMRHYQPNETGHAPRAWRIDLTPIDVPLGLHIQDRKAGTKTYGWYGYWPVGTRVSNNEWLLDHYPIRTREQAKNKARDRQWISPCGYNRYARHANEATFFAARTSRVESRELVVP